MAILYLLLVALIIRVFRLIKPDDNLDIYLKDSDEYRQDSSELYWEGDTHPNGIIMNKVYNDNKKITPFKYELNRPYVLHTDLRIPGIEPIQNWVVFSDRYRLLTTEAPGCYNNEYVNWYCIKSKHTNSNARFISMEEKNIVVTNRPVVDKEAVEYSQKHKVFLTDSDTGILIHPEKHEKLKAELKRREKRNEK